MTGSLPYCGLQLYYFLGHLSITHSNKSASRTCFFCEKPGHIKANCFAFKKTLRQQTVDTVNVAKKSRSVAFKVVACEKVRCSNTEKWCVDSGCGEEESSWLKIVCWAPDEQTTTSIFKCE